MMDKKTNKKHAAACRGSVGRALSILGLFRNRQKARKLGLLRPLPLQIIMKKTYFFTPVLCKSSRKSVILPRGKKYGIFMVGWGKMVDIIFAASPEVIVEWWILG